MTVPWKRSTSARAGSFHPRLGLERKNRWPHARERDRSGCGKAGAPVGRAQGRQTLELLSPAALAWSEERQLRKQILTWCSWSSD